MAKTLYMPTQMHTIAVADMVIKEKCVLFEV